MQDPRAHSVHPRVTTNTKETTTPYLPHLISPIRPLVQNLTSIGISFQLFKELLEFLEVCLEKIFGLRCGLHGYTLTIFYNEHVGDIG